VHVSLGGTEVLHGIDLRSLPSGRWTAIVGPNGAGKSTLLKVHGWPAAACGHRGAAGLGRWPLLGQRERARTLSWLGQGEGGLMI
jgi:iron complex transport system ATP-binding protein